MSNAAEIAKRLRKFLAEQKSASPDRRALAEAAIQAFLDFDERRDPASLPPLVTAARAPHRIVFETGAQLLAALAGPFEAARDAWLRLADDKSATARLHAVAYLDENMPEAFCVVVLERALDDKSSRVRQMAVEVADRLELKAMLPSSRSSVLRRRTRTSCAS